MAGDEPILTEPSIAHRYTVYPIKPGYERIFELYKILLANFWTVEEVDCELDIRAFRKLSQDEQRFVKVTLSFFAAADGIVAQNCLSVFSAEVKESSVLQAYAVQAQQEAVHAEQYSLLIMNLIPDSEERNKLFTAIERREYPSIKRKADWCFENMDPSIPFARRLIAFGCTEMIHFSSSFASIYYLKSRGIDMPGLITSNGFIARDEGTHCRLAAEIYRTLVNKLSLEDVHKIIKDAVNIEKEFCCDGLPVSIIGLNKESMCEHVEFVADKLCEMLCVDKVYNTPEPFHWFETICQETKVSFFEHRLDGYAKLNTLASAEDKQFSLDSEF